MNEIYINHVDHLLANIFWAIIKCSQTSWPCDRRIYSFISIEVGLAGDTRRHVSRFDRWKL